MPRILAAIIALGVVVVVGSPAHGAVDPVAVCKGKKAKATGKKASDLLRAFGNNMKRPDPARLDVDVSKAQSKFTKTFTKAESGTCQTTGDVGTIETKVDEFVADMLTTVITRFVDNGDGTITDNSTWLMWEKKDDNNVGGVHAYSDQYTWSTGLPWNPDGTAFTVFLDTLNNTCDGDESTACTDDSDCTGIGNGLCGHAGYRDWRLPSQAGCNACWTGISTFSCPCNPRELEKILLAPYSCGTDPCIDAVFNTSCTGGCTVTTCSCTASGRYWSSTPWASDPGNAWDVNFNHGLVFPGVKDAARHVRAVRGGSPTAAFLDATSAVLD